MKRYPLIIVSVFIMFAVAAQNVYATQWSFDKAHSGIYFDVRHIFSATRGNFTDFSGKFNFDPDNLKSSTIEITVQTQSVNTQLAKRDTHLRGNDFFAVSQYPTMTFKSIAIEHTKGDQYKIKGNLTVKDVTKTIEVPFTFHGITSHPLQKGKEVAGFDANFTIDRLTYHVGNGKFAKLGVVAKDVKLFISLEMLRDKP